MGPTRDTAVDPWWSPAGGSGLGAAPRTAADDLIAADDGERADVDAPTQPIVMPPLTRTGRRARAPRPPELPPARALAGALVAVAGVALGIGTLLWATGGVENAVGDPAVRPAPSASVDDPAAFDEPAVTDDPLAADPAPTTPAAAPAPAPPVAAPSPAPAAEPPPQAQPSLVVPVLVLNNSRISGLAARAARDLEAGGWPVRDTGSSGGRIRATTVYYPPGQEASARELASRFPKVQRVLPRLPNLPGEGLTLVVTRDYVS